MRRVLLLGALVIAACIAAAASAAPSGKTISIPLPAVQSAKIVTFKVVVKGTGALRVKTANDAALGNLSLVYAIGKPTKSGATSTWIVAVFIKRWEVMRRAAGLPGGSVDLNLESATGTTVFSLSGYVTATCASIKAWDKGFENGGPVNVDGGTYTLSNGRTQTEQPSPPEEVMDNIIAAAKSTKCPGFTPEGDDPGNK